jgi:hypothetical protein
MDWTERKIIELQFAWLIRAVNLQKAAVGRRTMPHETAEDRGKVLLIFETNGESYIQNRAFLILEQAFTVLDSKSLHVPVGTDANALAKLMGEVRNTQPCAVGQVLQADLTMQVRMHEIQSTAQKMRRQTSFPFSRTSEGRVAPFEDKQ